MSADEMSSLGLDEALLRVRSKFAADALWAYKASANCDKCSLKLVGEIPDSGLSESISSHYPWIFRIRNDGSQELLNSTGKDAHEICTVQFSVGEHGAYTLEVDETSAQCSLITDQEPAFSEEALISCFFIVGALIALYKAIVWAAREAKRGHFSPVEEKWNALKAWIGYKIPEKDVELDSRGQNDDKACSKGRKRLRSLDTFRGISIALMIFVNDGAGGYFYMEHATWNGLYLADLAFPWFIWIMGFCIPMGIRSALKRNVPLGVQLCSIFKRSIKLFLLGFFWGNTGWINLAKVRVPGVLQRFAISYLVVASTAAIAAHWEASKEQQPQQDKAKDKEAAAEAADSQNETANWRSSLVDLTVHWPRWVVCLACAFIHTLVIFLLPVPGCPTGYLGPAGLHLDSAYPKECVGGATGYIDRLILGNHIYQNPTAKRVYSAGAFDPEGVWGSMTTIVQVFLGYHAGQILLSYRGHRERIVRFLVWCVALGLAGLALCEGRLNDGWIPINKNLWSLSYVCVTSSLAFLLMAIVYVLVDVKHLWAGGPFFYAGMNSLVLYLGHFTGWQMLPFHYICGAMQTHWAKLPEAIWGTAIWMLVGYVMYRKKVFIKV